MMFIDVWFNFVSKHENKHLVHCHSQVLQNDNLNHFYESKLSIFLKWCEMIQTQKNASSLSCLQQEAIPLTVWDKDRGQNQKFYVLQNIKIWIWLQNISNMFKL